MAKRMTKEQVYDKQINPLMAQIIEICKRHKIAHFCSFSLDIESGLLVTTFDLNEECQPPEEFEVCKKVVRHNSHSQIMVTTTKAGGSKVVEAIL